MQSSLHIPLDAIHNSSLLSCPLSLLLVLLFSFYLLQFTFSLDAQHTFFPVEQFTSTLLHMLFYWFSLQFRFFFFLLTRIFRLLSKLCIIFAKIEFLNFSFSFAALCLYCISKYAFFNVDIGIRDSKLYFLLYGSWIVIARVSNFASSEIANMSGQKQCQATFHSPPSPPSLTSQLLPKMTSDPP